ncbi:MAG: sulfotransferase [Candidatus Pelagibacter sp.]
MSKKKSVFDKKTIINLFNEQKYNKISKYSKSLIDYYEMEIDICKLVIASEIKLKNYFKAEQILKKIIENNNTYEFNYLYGNILKSQNKFQEAISAYEKSISLNNRFSEAYNNLANTQKKIKENENAIYNYLQAIKSDSSNLSAYFNLANLYRSEKKYEESINNYEKVLELNPKFVEALNNIGVIHLILGNFKNAIEYFQKTIEIDEFHSESYFNYVSSKKITKNDEIFLKLQNFIEKEKNIEVKNYKMYFSLSKSYFDIENHELGFKYLKLAKNFNFDQIDSSFKKQIKNFNKIKEYFLTNEASSIVFKNYKSIPIFILGMPRSGTSLIEQILSNHSNVHGGGELDILPLTIENSKWEKNTNYNESLSIIRNGYLSKISKLSDKSFITDKLPGNFKWIGFILNAMPEAKILHLERNPMAVCWSIYKSNFDNPDMRFTNKQEFIAEFYNLYNDLMKFWKKKYPKNIININYEEFVGNSENNIRKLFQNLELNWENDLLNFYKNKRPVETSSFQQVRRKIYKNSSEEWKKYKNYLKPMMEVLLRNNIDY